MVSPEGKPSLEQVDPESLHIKEEQEKIWISHEGEQLNGLKEADIIRFPFTAVPVKSEVKEEKPQLLQLHQSQTQDQRDRASSQQLDNTDKNGKGWRGVWRIRTCQKARTRSSTKKY